MEKTTLRNRFGIMLLLLISGLITMTGCNQQPTAEAVDATSEASVYTGALRTDYENALDVTSQLALGVLRLEDTSNAVTAEQATQALPLWKISQGSTLTTESERLALAKQIEETLNDTQVAAIVAMQLTQADEQAWFQEQSPAAMGGGAPQGTRTDQGTGTGRFGSAGQNMTDEERVAMREQFTNMTDEERANMRSQFAQSGGGAPAGGAPTGANNWSSGLLVRAVVNLLTERSGQAVAAVVTQPAEDQSASTVEPAATTVQDATATPEPEMDTFAVPIITLVPWSTPEPEDTPTPEATQAAAAAASTTTPASTSASATVQPVVQTETVAEEQAATQTQGALGYKVDTDPGPPLTIQITTNSSEPNPLFEGGLIYRVGGFVYNPTDETYQVTAVHVTFFDASGFRGAFYAFPRKAGERPGGEWIAHGALEAQISCTVLGPGESCPFVAEIAGQDMASFLVHPDAKVAEWHESVGVTLSDTQIVDTGTSYVRISGTATNPNVYAIKNVVISALLLDDSGQTVSMGTGVVTSLEAGASTNFEIYVEKKAYTSYELHARAEQVVN
ncbi:MAG: hypothetical protein JXR84_20495 [Anaerolineae bacterium]|nr:hypothetical protein [Anaerolineae bacterium]